MGSRREIGWRRHEALVRGRGLYWDEYRKKKAKKKRLVGYYEEMTRYGRRFRDGQRMKRCKEKERNSRPLSSQH